MKHDNRTTGFGSLMKVIGGILLSRMGLSDYANKKELSGTPEAGKWYAITPAGAKTADGKPWHGLIKLGTENKVLVYFLGGGASTDAYTAARSHSVKDGFYNKEARNLDFIANMGIAGNAEHNPFRSWTVLIMQYATGDFHCGNGEFPYQDLEGKNAVLYHYGYRNYTEFMKMAMQYIEKPDDLLIAGFSAGGFGVSLLADDVVRNYFPEQEKFTVLVDSSVMYYDKWRETAENVWHAPKEISEKLVSDNLTLDGLRALSQEYKGRVRILFDCSRRDGALANHQAYFRKGEKTWTDEDGDFFGQLLKSTVAELSELPDTGIYIWDGLTYDSKHPNFTLHTIIGISEFYELPFSDVTIAQWVMDAMNGKVKSYGLELLQ
ncbi:MAG: pectin acetylesterase-family hydrolase [Lachnospiraceae bacterium]|nr:pectin acetylesterase-family hydrolase [Lachnospiraceae bacterium]